MTNIVKKDDRSNIFFLLIFSCILITISFLRFPDLRNEMKYFVVISEMLEKGNYFVMTHLNELYPDKPPLYFWILIFLKGHFPHFFYPFSLIIGGVIPFILTAFIIKGIFKNYIVSTLLMSTLFALGVSLVLRMDTLMTFFITLSLVNFYKLYIKETCILNENSFKKENLNFKLISILIYLPIAVAILVKGASGILVSLSAITFFLYLNRDLSYLKKIKIWWGLLFILSIIGVWFLLILSEEGGSEYIKLLLGQQTVGRAVNSFTHKRPFYFYILRLPLITMPYGIAFIFTTYTYMKDFKNRFNWSILEKFCFSWTFAPLLIFSIISGKLDIYLLPIFPGIMGLIWCYFLRKKEQKRFKTIYLIPKITLGALIILMFFIPKYNDMATLKNFAPIIKNQSNSNSVIIFSSPDGINFLKEISVPYINATKNTELTEILENGEEEYLIFGRTKYLKYFNETIKNEMSYNYNLEMLLLNRDYYFIRLKKIKINDNNTKNCEKWKKSNEKTY